MSVNSQDGTHFVMMPPAGAHRLHERQNVTYRRDVDDNDDDKNEDEDEHEEEMIWDLRTSSSIQTIAWRLGCCLNLRSQEAGYGRMKPCRDMKTLRWYVPFNFVTRVHMRAISHCHLIVL